ncbi:hypothetical protein [Candidatus Protochlamydia phocaeensis]|uniref:hypothetical protein n=1 Tax=Candidatus Protochlamydia phocaeensis TaxID=1414722 RepID=UPI000839AE2C|nr:hypothetical protein [Candidatus Protochlamydia phocaeensis]
MQRKIYMLIACAAPLLGNGLIGEEIQGKPVKMELASIEEQIASLKKRLHDAHLQEMQEEVEGQGLMIADWEAYSREIQKIKQKEEEIEHLQKQLEELQQRKNYLLKQSSQSLLT